MCPSVSDTSLGTPKGTSSQPQEGSKTMSRLQLNILIAAFEPEREEWLRRQLQSLGGGWTLTACDGLRLNAHETHARERDLIFLHWRSRELVAWEAALSPQGPRGRAPEGIVAEIEETGGTRLLRRTVIIGENISRNDLVFCADHGIKLIFPLPAKQSQWDDEFKEFNKKIQKFLIDELKGGANKEDQLTRSFQDNLRHWHKLSDEQKMNLCDELLTKLGDSAIYGELMAQKSIKDGDLKGAEAWLHRALSKNPSYVKAIQQLADIYGRQGKYDDALILLERLRSSDPRNMRRATQIGQIYMAKGEYLKAEKTLENAVCIDEFYRPAREELAKVKFMVGALDDAKRLLAPFAAVRGFSQSNGSETGGK